jgi:hypothetical protein
MFFTFSYLKRRLFIFTIVEVYSKFDLYALYSNNTNLQAIYILIREKDMLTING